MSTFQLTVSDTYVPDWTYIHGLRELFQNAIDNEATDTENKMYFEYNEDEETLLIGNKNSVLSRESLLFGYSTKRGDNKTIGSHGEGYKVAILVLLREGKGVTFYNKGVNEVWTTRLINSRKYKSSIPEIKVSKQMFTRRDSDSNLIIEITNISKSEYVDFKDVVLQLRGFGNHMHTSSGDLLLDEDLSGKMFVNGLYVQTDDSLTYGYNFKTEDITLDRDRKMIGSFERKLHTSKIILATNDEDFISNAITEQLPDAEFIRDNYMSHHISNKERLESKIVEKYTTEKSRNVYPISSNEDISAIPDNRGVRPLLVSSYEKDILRKSGNFYEPTSLDLTPLERLELLYSEIRFKLSENEQSEFKSILSELGTTEV